MERALVRELESVVGASNVFTDTAGRVSYSYDSQHETAIPDVVVHVSAESEVVAVVRCASVHGIPVVVRGAGSGMTGGAVPERGGILMNMERMNRILHFSTEDRLCFLEPGVVTAALQQVAAKHRHYYPPEPASAKFSTIGGNVAESAGGLGCVKYGLTKDFVEGMKFVTADGEIISTGVYTETESPFDLGGIITGSEGTLGIVTEIAMRLIPAPESRFTVLVLFRTLIEAVNASNEVLASGVNPSVLEFMDRHCIETVRDYARVPIPGEAGALLIVELEGDADEVAAGERILTGLFKRRTTVDCITAKTPEEHDAIWKLRESLSPAIAVIAPLKFNEDVCVPISLIPRLCAYVENLGKKHTVRVATFGHLGDGNIHVNFMTHWERPEEVERVQQAVGELFGEVIRMGGTLSGEHGIGMSKRRYLPIALDAATVAFEKSIKRALDPRNILNPGKIFPE